MATIKSKHLVFGDAAEMTMLSDEARKELISRYESDEIDPYEFEEGDGRYLRTVIYSEPGAGKTVLAARLSLPEEKMIYFDTENSTEVLADHPQFKGRVMRKPFLGFNETAYLLDHIEKEGVYKTVILDTITSAMDVEMFSILKTSGYKRADKEDFSQQDYGLMLRRLKWFLTIALMKDLNIILIGHVQEPTEAELVNGQKRRIIATEKQAVATTSKMGNIFFVEEGPIDGKRERFVNVRGTKKFQAKTRIQQLPDRMTDDDFVARIHAWRRAQMNAA